MEYNKNLESSWKDTQGKLMLCLQQQNFTDISHENGKKYLKLVSQQNTPKTMENDIKTKINAKDGLICLNVNDENRRIHTSLTIKTSKLDAIVVEALQTRKFPLAVSEKLRYKKKFL